MHSRKKPRGIRVEDAQVCGISLAKSPAGSETVSVRQALRSRTEPPDEAERRGELTCWVVSDMRRRDKWLIGVVAVIVVLVAIRAAMPMVIRDYINDQLQALEQYDGRVDDVDLALWR